MVYDIWGVERLPFFVFIHYISFMVKKQLQEHDFLNGGPKIQYTINFNDYTTSSTITFNNELLTDSSPRITMFDSSTTTSTYDGLVITNNGGYYTNHGNGEVRYNIEESGLEYYHDGTWVST